MEALATFADNRPRMCPVLDYSFDEDDGAFLDAVRERGSIAISPEGCGVHARPYVGARPDYGIDPKTPLAAYHANLEKKRRQAELAEKKARREQLRMARARPLILRLYQKMLAYPHATRDIAGHVAEEFVRFGKKDAIKRGISGEDWMWRRTRFLAGFK